MDWEQVIREMADKGLVTHGKVKGGDGLIAELKRKAKVRDSLHLRWLFSCLSEFSADWLYWLDYGKVNRN